MRSRAISCISDQGNSFTFFNKYPGFVNSSRKMRIERRISIQVIYYHNDSKIVVFVNRQNNTCGGSHNLGSICSSKIECPMFFGISLAYCIISVNGNKIGNESSFFLFFLKVITDIININLFSLFTCFLFL